MKFNLLIFIMVAVSACSPKEKETVDHTENSINSESHEMHAEKPKEAPKSPRTSAMAMINGNHIHIDYSSPSARGRQIFGGLVEYGEVWVTGAHKATSIQFDKAVKINGKEIPAGKYGLFTIPGDTEWTIILNQVWDMHLADDYDANKDVLRLAVPSQQLEETIEALTFTVHEKTSSLAEISIAWDNTRVSFDVIVP
jgi:hypothetical protein